VSETDNDYYGLETDREQQAWDSFERIPEPGHNPALDSFLEGKHLDHASLVRIGARLSKPSVLAVAFEGGIKYRDVVNGRRWSWDEAHFDKLKIVPGEDRTRAVICEGETDACRLTMLYGCDVAVMPAGAMNWRPTYTEQVAHYEVLVVGLDNDQAGEGGWAKIKAALPSAVRLTPPAAPEGQRPWVDWCDCDFGLVPVPELPSEAAPVQATLVSARDLLVLPIPEHDSWFQDALLPVGGTALLHGTFKSYKTWMALAMASSIAQGEPWCGFENIEGPGRVAYLNFEVPWAYYQERVRRFAEAAVNRDLFLDNYFGYEPLTRPNLVAGNQESEDRVLRALTEGGIQVVFLDPVRRAMGFADMNAENEVRRILRFAERCTEHNLTVVMLHHDNKDADRGGGGDPAGMTGSGAWAGDADAIISIQRPAGTKRDSRRRNLHFLLRNAPSPGPRGFELGEDGSVTWSDESWIEDEGEAAKGVPV
jgi:hypothetical protein